MSPDEPGGGMWRLVTLAALLFGAAFTLLLVLVPLADNDIWLLMKVGQLIVETRHVPDTVLFAFTTVRDNHFNSHEWLVSVVLHELDRTVGRANLMWVVGLVALVQFWLCVVLARRQSGSLGAALLLAMLAMACGHFRYVLRPEIFALLYLTLLLLVLDRCRDERRWPVLLWTIPLMLLWVNSHGSFLLAPAIVGLFALGEGVTAAIAAPGAVSARLHAGWRAGMPYAVAMLAMLATCLANPGGWHILAFPFQLQRSTATRLLIGEWLPTFSQTFIEGRPFWIFAACAAIVVALVVRLRRHLGATDAMLFALFLALALERNRHIVWFGFIALTVCARLLAHVDLGRARELRLRAAAAVLAAIGLVAVTKFGNANGFHITYAPSYNFSPTMVAELDNPAIKGPVLTSYELGGELVYRYWPRLQPSIDSRVDSYGDDYLLFHLALLQDEKLLDMFLEGNRVNYMLLTHHDLERKIGAMPSIRAEWHVRQFSGDTFLLERNQPLPGPAGAR